MTACTSCGGQLAAVPPPPGTLTPAWGHAIPPADGHLPGVPPVTVTYSEHDGWWDADCPEVPGFPVQGAQDLAEAKAIAWALLGKIMPPRPVAERAASLPDDRTSMKPSVGRIVHYVSYGTPGGEYGRECRAAIVTEIQGDPSESVGLCVLNPTGQFFNRAVPHHGGHKPDADEPSALCNGLCCHGGTWHWPERV